MSVPEASERLPLDQLTDLVPELRAAALGLCRNHAWADDLTQDTLLKAWSHAAQYEPGTNFRGWMFTILRNTFLTSVRRRKREVEDPDGALALRLTTAARQEHVLEVSDVLRLLGRLSDDQRQAVLLVGPDGFSYQQAAERCGCAIGSIKSRVSRARRRLLRELEGTSGEDEAPCDRTAAL